MHTDTNAQLSMIERIARALVLLAYFIELDGDVHVPMYAKFEAELQDFKKKEDAKTRARRLLLSYGEAGTQKAIYEGTSASIQATDICRILAYRACDP
jgi:hypothetical protein